MLRARQFREDQRFPGRVPGPLSETEQLICLTQNGKTRMADQVKGHFPALELNQ